jgi:regulatory protein
MLARRELSEAQVRLRLTRFGHAAADIDTTISRLVSDGAIDDGRTAGAIARLEVTTRRRGRRRARQCLAAAGIAPDVAERALDEVFAHVDEETLLNTAIDRRLRDGAATLDERELARLFRYLTGQGFEGDRVLRALRARQREAPTQSRTGGFTARRRA